MTPAQLSCSNQKGTSLARHCAQVASARLTYPQMASAEVYSGMPVPLPPAATLRAFRVTGEAAVSNPSAAAGSAGAASGYVALEGDEMEELLAYGGGGDDGGRGGGRVGEVTVSNAVLGPIDPPLEAARIIAKRRNQETYDPIRSDAVINAREREREERYRLARAEADAATR
ncbi:unnamed protein product, partial [Phaeothamnion confervicola]